jgi:hypothetical protein
MKSLAWFADWAFGPTGLPNLSAIAYGDFSHGETFQMESGAPMPTFSAHD